MSDTARAEAVTAGMSSAPGGLTYRRVLAMLTLLVAAWAMVWALLTPAFRSPDEQNHLNSVVRLAYGGGWPQPGQARFAPAVETAVEQAAYPADLPGRYTFREDVRQLVDVDPVPRAERTRIDATSALAPPGSGAEVDQMTQHPPGYYALGAGVLRLTGLADARWDQAMLGLRLLDVVLFAATVPLAAAAALRLTGSRPVALVAAPLPVLVPQVGHIMGSVNNDALVVLACAATTYLSARVVTGDLRLRVAVAIGVVLGIGLLTKVMVAFALPTVLAAYVLAPCTTWGTRLTRGTVSTLVALAVGGWWWLRNVLALGVVQPVGRSRDLSSLSQVPGDQALSLSVSRVTQSFFGQLGWLEVRLDGDLVVLGATVLATASAVALVRPGARRATTALLLLPGALAGGVVYNALDLHAETGVLVALQGRYVYGGLAALAAVVAVAVWHLLGRSSRRTARAVPVATGAAVLVGGVGLWWGLTTMYQGPGERVQDAVDRWLAWTPLPPPYVALLVGCAVLVALAAVAATVLWAGRAREGEVSA